MTAPSARSDTAVQHAQPALIHAYTVRLLEIEPPICRRIEVDPAAVVLADPLVSAFEG